MAVSTRQQSCVAVRSYHQPHRWCQDEIHYFSENGIYSVMYEKITSSDINAAAEELRTTWAAKMKRSVTQQQTSRMEGLFNVSQLLWQSSKTSDRFNKVFFSSIIFKKSINHTQNKPSVSKQLYFHCTNCVHLCALPSLFMNNFYKWQPWLEEGFSITLTKAALCCGACKHQCSDKWCLYDGYELGAGRDWS